MGTMNTETLSVGNVCPGFREPGDESKLRLPRKNQMLQPEMFLDISPI